MSDRAKEIPTTASSPLSKSLLKVVLIIHFVLIAAYTFFILHTYSPFPPGITLTTLIFYGFMGAWVWVINFILVVVSIPIQLAGCQECATAFNRLGVKIVMFIFPLFALLSMSNQP